MCMFACNFDSYILDYAAFPFEKSTDHGGGAVVKTGSDSSTAKLSAMGVSVTGRERSTYLNTGKISY